MINKLIMLSALKKKFIIGLLLQATILPTLVQASEITIRPFLIDETLNPRENVSSVIIVKNDYPSRKAVLYATVNEISLDATGEIKEFISPIMTDRSNTVTSWIQITRGRIEVMPGEVTEVPLTIKTHPQAEPGEYHVFVGIVEAPNRPKAEAKSMSGDADGVIVKVTITDQRKDNMRISGFFVNRFVTNEEDRKIDVEVENTGDLASVPVGEIIFYDSRGIEVASAAVNDQGATVKPGEKIILTTNVPFSDDMGRFKANVSLRYGNKQTASLADTAFFYMLSPYLLIIVFGGILIIAMLIAFLLKRHLRSDFDEDHVDDVAMYVQEGLNTEPKDHDINLKNSK